MAELSVPRDHAALRQAVHEDGFALFPRRVSPDEVDAAVVALEGSVGGAPGLRNLLASREVRRLATCGAMWEAATALLGSDCGAVRAILFDKNEATNWRVAWHQDLTIAVESRIEAAGYGPWSLKDRVPHVRPPVSVLERMVAVRVHLDACSDDEGPLRIVPGSHRSGILGSDAIDALRVAGPEHSVVADRGELLIMRPLLLHASSRARSSRQRRVLHVEYGPRALPGGVSWHEWIAGTPA